MPHFDIIDHTADIGITAYGNDHAEVFSTAAHAMFSLITELDNVEEKVSCQIEKTEDGMEVLLVSWLNELLYIYETEHMLLKRFDIIHLDKKHIEAIAWGEKIDRAKHLLTTDIKAATYHLLSIERTQDGGYAARVIFDT